MVTKREFNNHWRQFFLEMEEDELCTVVQWVTGMKSAFLWEPFVAHCQYELEVARMEAESKEQTIEDEPEVLH